VIHVHRGPAPEVFSSPHARKMRKELAAFFETPHEDRKRKRFSFDTVSRWSGVTAALRRMFNERCAYCESPIFESSPGQIDSFRPKQRAMGHDGEIAEDHYWWLAYEWTNLVAACLSCNRAKATRFPVRGQRAYPGSRGAALRRERPLLLDPCFDHPEQHLLFDEQGRVASASPEGQATIEVLALNRTDLCGSRAEMYRWLRARWEALSNSEPLAELAAKVSASLLPAELPYLALRRQCVQQWSLELAAERYETAKDLEPLLNLRTPLSAKAPSRRAIQVSKQAVESTRQSTHESYRTHLKNQESFSVEADDQKAQYYAKARWIERITIHNFKVIRDLDLVITPAQDRGACLLLLGENGVGKSSILQAVALALMGRQHQERLPALDASTYLTAGEEDGFVKVYLTGDPEPVQLHFRRGSPRFELKPEDPKVLMLGYGATRLLPRAETPPITAFGASKADNLFSPFVPLSDASSWLCTLAEGDFERMKQGLRSLLLLPDGADIKAEAGTLPTVRIETHGIAISLERLSDGFQSVVALAADIMSVMRLRWPEMDLAEGIVLIDEIDAHLHPRWKMQVVQRLREVFPRLQFLMTSHDPLCLRGLRAGEVAVLRRNGKGAVWLVEDLPSPEGLRIDQILTSDFFGLNSTRSPEDDELFDDYYRLLALRNPTAAQKARLVELKAKLAQRDLMGTTPRERLMLEAADRFVAASRTTADADQRHQLDEATKQKIVDLWSSVKPAPRGTR
jgi:uncharacterized protein (TIGR02646 family)